MSRIKIDLPATFSFHTHIPIRITDLNYGNHVGNDTILTLIHEARVQFLKYHQLTELDCAGTSLIMSDAAIEFRSELFYGDHLIAHVTVGAPTRVGFHIYYKLMKENTIVATAATGMVCYNYDTRKVTGVPDALKKILWS